MLSTQELIEGTGLSYRMFHYWIRNGIIDDPRPPVFHSTGNPMRWPTSFRPRVIALIEHRNTMIREGLNPTREHLAVAWRATAAA